MRCNDVWYPGASPAHRVVLDLLVRFLLIGLRKQWHVIASCVHFQDMWKWKASRPTTSRKAGNWPLITSLYSKTSVFIRSRKWPSDKVRWTSSRVEDRCTIFTYYSFLQLTYFLLQLYKRYFFNKTRRNCFVIWNCPVILQSWRGTPWPDHS